MVTNTLGALLGRFGTDMARRWIAFVVALACAYGAAVYATTGHRHLHGYEWLLAFVNACLIWTSAFGVNQTLVHTKNDPHGMTLKAQSTEQKATTRENFFRSWV
jgi:hypothetical protein